MVSIGMPLFEVTLQFAHFIFALRYYNRRSIIYSPNHHEDHRLTPFPNINTTPNPPSTINSFKSSQSIESVKNPSESSAPRKLLRSENVGTRKGRKGAGKGRSEATPQGAQRQHPGHNQAGDQEAGS
ncbi:hypothetical protein Vadar_033979 [Vaccinium darrowii]|uniref:Uncharacterized protein n=1 Tax=Vaccinium darrowii TaxID=229202 RepID=A0ACB7XE60_9ERIC|nr:hypothetical protein Vadar_033979 [Vaccinium darrowii]